MSALNDYYAALERLKANKPEVLPKGSAINNDTVALEAGRKRGSIKKSRHATAVPQFFIKGGSIELPFVLSVFYRA